MRIRHLLFSILFLILLLPGVSSADSKARSEHTEAELLSDVASIQPGQSFWVALRLRMDKDWHTYWKNPGDSGLATQINWNLPKEFEASSIRWPYPKRLIVPPLGTYGYENEVFLFTEINAPDSLSIGDAVDFTANIEWLECKVECLPGFATLTLRLPVDKISNPSSIIKEFSQARTKLPLLKHDWNIQAELVGKELIRIHATPPDWFSETLSKVYFFPSQELLLEPTAVQTLHKTDTGYLLEIPRLAGMEDPQALKGVLYSSIGWRGPDSEKALEISVPFTSIEAIFPVSSITNTAQNSPAGSVWWSIILAFLGGLLLNLMPCVLPVLSIKVLSFVEHAGESKRKAWQHGAVFSLGILVSFWVLAGVLIALRASGENLGWGFQLQSPSFLVILSSVLFLFALNLFGVFEIGTSLTQAGSLASKSGFRASFSSGVLATIVATPCTAPYMGSALGFAMTQPVWAAMLIFSALGFGMAFPYLLLSLMPSLLRFVPKPGPWMESFKQFMGFLLLGTVVWLVWVLGQQVDHDSVTIFLGALITLSLGAWILGRWGGIAKSPRSRIIAFLLALLVSIGGLSFTLLYLTPSTAEKSLSSHGIVWEPFSSERIQELQAKGTPVFLDFTAAWCLSCQVNERVVFSSSEVREEFRSREIVTMKADWTNRDEKITEALAQFGRSGVPLYVLYGKTPGQKPMILPEILTPSIVLEALEKML